MKIAWLCWACEGDNVPEFRFKEPEGWMFWKVTQIVYAEVQE